MKIYSYKNLINRNALLRVTAQETFQKITRMKEPNTKWIKDILKMGIRMKDNQYLCSLNHQRNPLDRDYISGVYQLPSHTMKLPHSISTLNARIYPYICSICIIGLLCSTFRRVEIHRTSSIVKKTSWCSCKEI